MKFYKNFVVVWAVIYFLIAMIGRTFSPDKEYFPFFRWSLYSKTPNEMVHPYVMVSQFGEEVLPTPTDVILLRDYHKIGRVDMNLNVSNFYNEVISKENPKPDFLKLFPPGSKFILYEKKYDLSKKDYENTLITRKIAIFENDQLLRDE